MEFDQFLVNFRNQFEDTDPSEINPSTEFKKLDEWSSLVALSLIAMADEEYDVALKGDDVKNATTVEDLFKIIKIKAE